MSLRVTQLPGASLEVTYTESTQPTGLVLVGVTDSTATLRCNPSLPTDNTYIKAYRWYVDGASTVDTTTPNVVLTGLDGDTDYWVGVSAITSKSVESEQTDAILVTTEAAASIPGVAPTTPTTLTETASPADYTAFTWVASSSVDEYPLLGYRIYRDGAEIGTTTALHYLDTAVIPATTYTYQVAAYTAGAESVKASIAITTDAAVSNVFAFRPIYVPENYRAGQTTPEWYVWTVNGQGAVTTSLLSGTMPPGMTILPDGTVPSVPLPSTAQGTYNFTARAVDATGQTITTAIEIVIGYAILTVTLSSAPPSAVNGASYSLITVDYIRLSGGDGVYDLTVRSGTYLPTDLTLGQVGGDDAVWNVSGTCNGGSGQTYTAILDATSGDGQTAAFTLTIPVQAVTPVAFSAVLDALPNFTVGVSYSTKNVTVSGASGTVYVLREGSAPTGMTAADTQSGAGPTFPIFSGIATAGAGLSFTGRLVVRDSSTPPQLVYVPYSLTGEPAVATGVTLTMPTFDAGVPGASYTETATASGGVGPLYGYVDGILPPGISLTPDVLTAATSWTWAGTVGNSAAGQTYTGTLRVIDAGNGNALTTAPWSITVNPLSTAFVAPSLSTTLPTVTAVANVSESNPYNVADYVDYGSLTAADVTVGIEATSTLLPGMSVSMSSGDTVFNVDYDATTGSNPASNTSIPYRLSLTYNEPTGDPPSGDLEADWVARSTGTGVLQVEDFRSYANTAALLAASVVGSNQNSTSSNGGANFMVELDATDGITGGKCLKITTFATAGAQGGGFGRGYRSDGAAINGFYFQFAVKLNEAAAYWESGADTKKIMQLEAYGTGQVSVLAGTHGFPTLMVNGSEGVKRYISSTGYGGDYFRQTAIDTGATVISGNAASYAQRYGLSQYLTTGTQDYSAGGLVNQRGFQVPEPNALIAGAVPFTVDGWTVIEIYVYNDLTDNANDVFKMWAAPYGAAPTLIVDNRPGGAGTFAYQTLGVPNSEYYKRWEALNYPTGRAAESGRLPQIQKYDQFIPSTNWIPFPGHLTGTEP